MQDVLIVWIMEVGVNNFFNVDWEVLLLVLGYYVYFLTMKVNNQRMFFFLHYLVLNSSREYNTMTHWKHMASLESVNSKIVISQKISPLTYPEKSRLFLKRRKEAFCKKNSKKCLTWLSKNDNKSTKTSKFDQILWIF